MELKRHGACSEEKTWFKLKMHFNFSIVFNVKINFVSVGASEDGAASGDTKQVRIATGMAIAAILMSVVAISLSVYSLIRDASQQGDDSLVEIQIQLEQLMQNNLTVNEVGAWISDLSDDVLSNKVDLETQANDLQTAVQDHQSKINSSSESIDELKMSLADVDQIWHRLQMVEESFASISGHLEDVNEMVNSIAALNGINSFLGEEPGTLFEQNSFIRS